MKPKVRELSIDFEKAKKGERAKGCDFYVTSKENPIKLKTWVKKELEDNKIEYKDIRVGRPEDEFVTPVTRTTISNYLRKFRE
jgi:plasmid replication initiation protein